MDKIIAAWTAALIDGEGSVMLTRRQPRKYTLVSGEQRSVARSSYRPVVVVAASTDYRLMEAIQERLEVGQIYEHAVSNTSQSYNPRARRQWTYRLNIGQIKELIPHVRPYLVLKGEQIDLLFEAMRIKASMTPGQLGFLAANREPLTQRLDEIYAEIRRLNTKGREAVS